MGWDQKRGGHYCDRCDAAICLNYRQQRFVGVTGIGVKGGDPYVSVNRTAFAEEGKRFGSGFMYCFDCEPALFEVLKKFNEERDAKLQGDGKL